MDGHHAADDVCEQEALEGPVAELRRRARDQAAPHDQRHGGVGDGEHRGEDHQALDREPRPGEVGRPGGRMDVLEVIAGRAVVGLDRRLTPHAVNQVERRLGPEAHLAEHGTAPRIESRDTDSDRIFILRRKRASINRGPGCGRQPLVGCSASTRADLGCGRRDGIGSGSVLAEHPTKLSNGPRFLGFTSDVIIRDRR